MRSRIRIVAVTCAVLMVVLAFQTVGAQAHVPNTGANEYNHAASVNGATASASGSYASNVPGNAIDGQTPTYWQSSTTTGWLAVRFAQQANVDEVHVHFKTTKYSALSLWADKDGDGTYEAKVWSATKNAVLDVVAGLAPTLMYGVKVTIDAKAGSNKPMISEFEAYLRYDTDGDGLLNSFETGTVYYFTSSVVGTPVAVPDVGTSSTTLQTNQLSGVPFRGLVDFTVDHAAKEELSASLAYWDGSAWVETPVWDPGGRLVTPQITAPEAGQFLRASTQVEAIVASPSLVTRVEFYVDSEPGPRATVTSPEGSIYRWTWDTSLLAEGYHTLRARSYDVWGGAFEGTVSVRADRTPPTVTISSPGPDAVVTSRDVLVQWTATDAGVGLASIAVGPNGVDWTPLPAGTISYMFHFPSDGYWTAYVRATDQGGLQTVASRSVRVDTQPPSVRITSPGNNAEFPSGGIVMSWESGDDGSSVVHTEVWHDGAAHHDATGLSSWAFSLFAGYHTLSVKVTDAAGHWNSALIYVTVDETPPTVTLTDPASGAYLRGVVTLKATATDDYTTVTKVEFYVGGVLRATATNGPVYYSASWDTSGIAEGTHSIVARAYNSAGWTADSGAVSVKVDRTPPTATIVNPLGYDVCDLWTSRMQGTASDNLGLGSVYFIDQSISQPGAPTTWSGTRDVTFHYSTSGGNTHTYVITPTDAAGNTGATQSTDVLVHSATSIYCKGGYSPSGSLIEDTFATPELLLSWPGEGYYLSRQSVTLTAGTGASSTDAGYYATNGDHRIVVNLTRPLSSMTAAERSARILPPGLPPGSLNAYQSWRLTVRDWVSGAQGSVIAFSLRIEEMTSAASADTDGDGLTDGQELRSWGTSPVALDTDADGLNDGYEVVSHDLAITVDGVQVTKTVKTEPLLWDGDSDGLSDGEEMTAGIDGVITDPTNHDTDGDGLWDGYTATGHLGEFSCFTDPTWKDTDGDDLSDYDEVVRWGTSPVLADSDDDGVTDYIEVSTPRYVTLSFSSVSYPTSPIAQGFTFRSLGYPPRAFWHLDTPDTFNYFWSEHGVVDIPEELVSPRLDLRDAVRPRVSFSYSRQGTGTAEVWVQMTPVPQKALSLGLVPAGQWSTVVLDLQPYQASATAIRIYGASSDPAWSFSIDDFSISAYTNPLVDDTDHDGIEDGAEGDITWTNPILPDTDFDGVPDFTDPLTGRDDMAPRVVGMFSDDYRTNVDLTIEDESGIVQIVGHAQYINGMMYPVTAWTRTHDNVYHISFSSDQPEIVFDVYLSIRDASGLESWVQYTLQEEPQHPGYFRPVIALLELGGYASAGSTLYSGGAAGVYVAAGTVAAGLTSIVILGLLVVFLFVATWPSTSSTFSPSEPNVPMTDDAEALATWQTPYPVSLYPGFASISGGFVRGVGWNFISAIYPSATYDLLGTILWNGAWTLVDGSYYVVQWTTVVYGVAYVYQLLVADHAILRLEVSEIVIDADGNEIAFDDAYFRSHMEERLRRAAEAAASILTALQVLNALKERNSDRFEIWAGTGPTTTGRLLYVHQPAPGADLSVVIAGPMFNFPFFVITAFKPGTQRPDGTWNPNPTLAEQWFDVAALVCAVGLSLQYGLHVWGDIKDPIKPYAIRGNMCDRKGIPPILW